MLRNGFPTIFLIAVLQLWISFAKADGTAGVIVFPSVTMRQETGTIAGDQTSFHTDYRAGYLTGMGLYFGMIHSRSVATGSYGINESSWGNTVGYFYGIAQLMVSYYMLSTNSESSPTQSITRSEGSGLQFDLNFIFPLQGHLSIGPVLTFKTLTYKKQENPGGIITNNAQSESYIYPYLGIMLTF